MTAITVTTRAAETLNSDAAFSRQISFAGSALSGSLGGIIVGRALQGASGAILPLCYGITRERIRQIEARSLSKLRQPIRSHRLAGFTDRVK